MHHSARSSRTRVSSSPSSVPEVAMASPTSPSQAASSSLVPTVITSSVSTPQLVASTLASTSSALPSHLYASSLLASPIFPARVASPSLDPALPTMAVPRQRQPGPTSNFHSGNFPQPLSVQAPSMGPYVGSSSNLSPVPQWPATTPGFQPYSASFSSRANTKLSFQVRHLCLLVTTRSPVSVAFFRRCLPQVICPPLALRRFQLLISPPLLWVQAPPLPRRSQDSCCDSLQGIY